MKESLMTGWGIQNDSHKVYCCILALFPGKFVGGINHKISSFARFYLDMAMFFIA